MKPFKQFLEEKRKIDPVALAIRAARIHGKKTNYGDDWEPAEKQKNFPLKGFKSREAEKVSDLSFGLSGKNPKKELTIKKLIPTQPFVRLSDVSKLKKKLGETDPDNINIAKYKGKHYILDGHHSIFAAALRGEKTVKARITNLKED